MKAAPIIASFNSGEFSPLMAARADLKNYATACRRIRNFVPVPQGPARRRAGTRFVREVKNSTQRTWLSRFVFNNEQAYVLEFGHQYIRFYSQHGVVAFELATPYNSADLTSTDGTFALRVAQSGDVMYIVHRLYRPKKLVRTSASTFSLQDVFFVGGPFKDVNVDQTTKVFHSGGTAVVTLTSTAPVFQPDIFNPLALVGTLFYLEAGPIDQQLQWEPGKVIAVDDIRRSDGKNYKALNAGTTGSVRPIHAAPAIRTTGAIQQKAARFDGSPGVQWEFIDPGYGWCEIVAVATPQSATGVVHSRMPFNAQAAGTASNRWAYSAWNSMDGYPDTVVFFRERLCFTRGREIWCSVAGDFENFQNRDDGGVVTAEMALRADMTSKEASNIMWTVDSAMGLLIGTDADEQALFETTTVDPFGPGNAAVRGQTQYGSRRVAPVVVGEGVLFVQNSGRKIRDMRLSESVNVQWTANDTTVLAEHITKSGIIDIAYQQDPDYILWCARADGGLIGFTINREQEVKGWHSHRIGGYNDLLSQQFAAVESIVTIPSPAKDRDEVWMVVRRLIAGVTKRYVEWMEYFHDKGDNPQDSFYVDAGLTLNNAKNAVLTPGAGATVKGTTNVPFTSSAAMFLVGDIGRQIHHTYRVVDVTGAITWRQAVATITGFTSTTVVTCRIDAAFPGFAPTAGTGAAVAGLTVTNAGLNYNGQTPATFNWPFPVLSFVGGGGGVGAAGTVTMGAIWSGTGLGGAGYVVGEILTLVGGVFTRPAKFQVVSTIVGIVNAVECVDPGDYSAYPPIDAPSFAYFTTSSGAGVGCTLQARWGLSAATVTSNGTGYTGAPACVVSNPSGAGVGAAISVQMTDPGTGATIPAPIAANDWRMTITVISGLGHLEGQDVQILADGATHAGKRVIFGQIGLDRPASKVHVGLRCPAVLQPMPLEAGAADGTAQGKTKRISRAVIRFDDTIGAKYGREETGLMDQIRTREPTDAMDEAPPLFTGDKIVSWPDGYSGPALITILQEEPLPCTVVGIFPQVNTQDDR